MVPLSAGPPGKAERPSRGTTPLRLVVCWGEERRSGEGYPSRLDRLGRRKGLRGTPLPFARWFVGSKRGRSGEGYPSQLDRMRMRSGMGCPSRLDRMGMRKGLRGTPHPSARWSVGEEELECGGWRENAERPSAFAGPTAGQVEGHPIPTLVVWWEKRGASGG